MIDNGYGHEGQPEDILHFMQPFDGLQPKLGIVEKEKAATRFTALCERLFERYKDENTKNRYGEKVIQTAVDMPGVRITFRVYESLDLDIGKYIVDLYIPTKKGTTSVHCYGLSRDDYAVLRSDLKGGEETRDSFVAISEDLTIEESMAEYYDRVTANEELEQTMGFNNQPVSEREVAGLEDLLSKSQLVEIKQ